MFEISRKEFCRGLIEILCVFLFLKISNGRFRVNFEKRNTAFPVVMRLHVTE